MESLGYNNDGVSLLLIAAKQSMYQREDEWDRWQNLQWLTSFQFASSLHLQDFQTEGFFVTTKYPVTYIELFFYTVTCC